MSKYFILNAENFGASIEHNQAVLNGYNNGFLTSASLYVSGQAFSAAVNDIIPECPNLGIGIQLNITSGKSLTKCVYITDSQGNFNRGHVYYFLNQSKPEVLHEIEQEFRAQIELMLNFKQPDHITSSLYVHTIPPLFEIAARLANEYNIPFITTINESLYLTSDLKSNINLRYLSNLLNLLTLKYHYKSNTKIIKKYNLRTNTNVIGLCYTGLMNAEIIKIGLEKCTDKDCVVEGIIQHSDTRTIRNGIKISQDIALKDTIERLGFEITNYRDL